MVQERLISYVTVRTPSNEESETVPSSMCQFDLALARKRNARTWSDEVVLDDKCYLYGKLPATKGKIFRRLDLLHIWIPYQFLDHEIHPIIEKL